MMMVMATNVLGSCVSLVSDVPFDSRIEHFMVLELLRERKLCAAGEQNKTNEYARPRLTKRRGKNRTGRVDAA
jgi:hypothetical protein